MPKSTKVEPAVAAFDLGVVCFCVEVDVCPDTVVDVGELVTGGRDVDEGVAGGVVVGKVVVVVLVVVVVVGAEVVVLVDVVVVWVVVVVEGGSTLLAKPSRALP